MDLLSIRAIKIYKWIAVILVLSALAGFMYMAYENVIRMRKSIGQIDVGIEDVDKVIQEWTIEYGKDIQNLNKIDRDLYEAQIRLRMLYKEAGLEY